MEEFNHGKIEQVNISQEMKSSFLDYSMSVIIARALPDVKDGMKPVHRRIIYAMYDLGMTSDKPHRKSARIVGDVIAKYHPHGDSAVYESMVRMAQPFSYRYRLVDGHGNFGSIDGDRAAAMRYTEARMSKISTELIRDLYKDTVAWSDNYDGELKEPVVLPCRFPNLLVNGATGIAVGMATNIPPHNLNETIDATIAIIDNPEISVVELMNKYIKGPDFPTGAYIVGSSNIKKAYETGRGSITIRSKVTIEDGNSNKKRIIIKELPYQVNKAQLVEKIAHLVKDKTIDGITALNDESNREGIKVVIDLRRDAQAEVILNQLYRLTPLQTNFSVNSVVLVGKTPKLVGLKELLTHYIDHQIDIVKNATKYDLKKAEEKAHILEGFKIVIDNIDEVIAIIRSSKDTLSATNSLKEKFKLSDLQAKAILEMQLRRLTGLERDKIIEDLKNTLKIIEDLKDILNNHHRVIEIIKNDLIEIKNKYGDERKTEIINEELELLDEDLIPVDNVIISMTTNGYIKRIPLSTYKSQHRGGVGIKGMSINNDDIIDQFINMETHDQLLLFSNLGKVYRIKGYQIPEASRISKGIPIVNIIQLAENEKIKSLISYKESENDNEKFLFFVTKKGLCKKTSLKEFKNINQNGKIAIKLLENDELIGARITKGANDILIGASNGKLIRFNETNVRAMGRNSIGVKAMNLDGHDVIGFATTVDGEFILVISEKGYGKLSKIDSYKSIKRGGKGLITIKTTEKNGKLVSLKVVNGDEDCLIMTNDGVVIRIDVKDISISGRATQGVKLIKTKEDNVVSSVVIVDKENDEQEETEVV